MLNRYTCIFLKTLSIGDSNEQSRPQKNTTPAGKVTAIELRIYKNK